MSYPFDRPEDDFRRFREDVHERSMRCCSGMDWGEPCKKIARYLISGDFKGDSPDVCGIDGAKVEFICWGGDDIDNSTIIAYCPDCAAARERGRRERPESGKPSACSMPVSRPKWRHRVAPMPHVYCFIEETTLEGDYGEVEGVRAKCQRCEHATESYGASDASKRRCLALMHDQCPGGENNFYEEDTGH